VLRKFSEALGTSWHPPDKSLRRSKVGASLRRTAGRRRILNSRLDLTSGGLSSDARSRFPAYKRSNNSGLAGYSTIAESIVRPHDRFDKRLHIPVILLNNDPSNPRQMGALPVMGRPPQILDSSIRRESFASRRPLCVFIATGSRRSKTQKLSRFGHFGIPCLQLFRGKEAFQPRAQFSFVRYDCFDDVVPGNVRMGLLVFMQLLGRRSQALVEMRLSSLLIPSTCSWVRFIVLCSIRPGI
jgi:hypothetical protein